MVRWPVDKPTPQTYYSSTMASQRLQRQIERLLDEAVEAIAQREWASVLERAQDVVAIDPEHEEGHAFLAAAERALATTPSTPTSQPAATTSIPATTPTQPTSFANGRYQVKRILGEGGKKRVYLAHDATLDRDVSFALIMRMPAKDPSERPDSATDVFAALDAIDLAISGEVPAIPDDEAHSLGRLVGEPFVYVRNAERDSNDPADLSVSLSLLSQIIIAAWGEDLCKSRGD